MAFVAAAIPAVIGIFSSISQKRATKVAGIRAQGQKEIEAKNLEYQAGQVKAAAQQEGFEQTRKAKIMASRALALSAAGGGGTNEGEGAYRQAVALYQGEQNALRLQEGARISRAEGNNAIDAARQQGKALDYQAAGYAAQGISSMYSKYSQNQPKLSTGTDVNT
jgi:hypothetical protein